MSDYYGIAIAGKAGSGKNHLARDLTILLRQRGFWPVEVSFAEPIKDYVKWNFEKTKADPGGRELMVRYGEQMRKIDPLHWVKRLQEKCDSLIPIGGFPIVTDMRRINELEWAESAGFYTVRVDALRMDRLTGIVARGGDPMVVDSECVTETELDEETGFDMRVFNPYEGTSMYRVALGIADIVSGRVDVVA